MREVLIVSGLCTKIRNPRNLDIIGVDAGALLAFDNNIKMVLAIGDFDSINSEQLKLIQADTKLIKLNVNKNETDTEAALIHAKKMGYDSCYITGALGGRIDHTLTNIALLSHFDNVYIIDEHQSMILLKKGNYKINKQFKYLSFIANEDCLLTLSNVVYPLNQYLLKRHDIIGISNEILKTHAYACVEVSLGSVLCIQSEDAI